MTDFTHSLAILIGIDAYANGIPRLTTAVNDAARLAELLRDAHGYETILLTEPATGQPVTRARLHTLFTEELPARLGDDDRLLVYFAGHGVALDGDDGPRGYLVPQDARPGDSASMLAMTDLHAWLSALPCRHMLAILDCCFAGAFRWAATRHIGALPDVIYRERYDRYLRSPAWQVLTSAAYDQTALDVLAGDAKRGALAVDSRLHSPFALALFDALANGEADLAIKGKRDGVITATELYHYLREQVEVQAEEQASHEQTPGLWPLNKHRKGEFIFLAPGHPLNLPPAPDLTTELNPYRGLKSYDQQHAPLFFGREDEIRELVQKVDTQPFLAVLGASGTGKSSLVKAGLLPRLKVRSDDLSRPAPAEATEVATTNVTYRVLPPMRPTDRPVRALETLLRAEPGFRSLADFGSLDGGDNALAQIIARWAATHPGQRLVLTIDQFEELATLCRDDAERARFLRLLAAAVEQQADAFRLIITLRTDFEPQFTQAGSPLAGAWGKGRYVVPPMDIEDLRQVIEGPASVRVLYFDPSELVDDLIKEVIQTPGALPLLSFTLSELYVKYVRSGRDDRALSGADYQALGGVVGSLRNRASEEYDVLPDDAHRLTMQRVMLRMVAVEGGELARRRVALSELEYPTAEENVRVRTVLDRLVEARLLVRDSDNLDSDGNPDPYVEPAHDALVLAWDVLLRWKKDADDTLPLQRRLWQSAKEWQDAPPAAKPGLLWDDDPRLPQVEETLWPTGGKQEGLRGRLRWARQVLAPKTDAPADTKWLNTAELAFVQASVSARARFWQRTMSLGLVVFVVVGTLLVFGLNQQQQSAASAQAAATEQALRITAQVAQADEAKARTTSEANAALAATREVEARTAEATAVAAQQQALVAKAETERLDRAIRADQLTNEALKLAKQSPPTALLLAIEGLRAQNDHIITHSLALDTNGADSQSLTTPERVVTSAQRNVVELLSQVGGRPLPGVGDAVETLEWSRDGRWLVSSRTSVNGAVRISNMANSAEDALQLRGASLPSALSPDGRWLATGSLMLRVYLWDMANPLAEPISLNTGSQVNSLAFSADGRWLAVGVDSNMAYLWDMTRLTARPFGFQHDRDVEQVAISPNNRWLATAERQGQVQLWSLTGETSLPIILAGTTASVTDLFFSADNQWLVAASSKRTVHLWPASVQASDSISLSRAIPPVAITSDGLHLATSSANNAPLMWNMADTNADPIALQGGGGPILALTFSADGCRLAAGSEDHTVRIWDTTQLTPTLVLQGHEAPVQAVAFSPNADQLASGSKDQMIRVWNLPDPAVGSVVLRGHTEGLTTLAFSADGHWLATGSQDKAVRLWDMTNPNQTSTVLEGHAGEIAALLFSADNRSLASAAMDGSVRIWRVTEPDHPPAVVESAGGDIAVLALSHDGRWLGAASADGKVWLADLSATGISSNLLTDTQASIHALAFSPNSRWLAAGTRDKKVWLWDLANPGLAPVVLTGHEGRVSAVAFSANSAQLATGSWDSKIRVWSLVEPLGSPNVLGATLLEDGGIVTVAFGIGALAFSSDGRWLASTSLIADGRLFDLGKVNPKLYWLNNAFAPLAFAADGQWLATGSDGNAALMWDVMDLAALPIEMQGHTARIRALAFSPDGRWLATGSEDTTARLWPLNVTDLIEIACRTAGRNLTRDEWNRYLRGVAYRSTCSQWLAYQSLASQP